jgi:hypothetical protein
VAPGSVGAYAQVGAYGSFKKLPLGGMERLREKLDEEVAKSIIARENIAIVQTDLRHDGQNRVIFSHLRQSGLPDGLFSNQKSQIWVNFGGPLNGKCWCILWPFGIIYGHLVLFMVI